MLSFSQKFKKKPFINHNLTDLWVYIKLTNNLYIKLLSRLIYERNRILSEAP